MLELALIGRKILLKDLLLELILPKQSSPGVGKPIQDLSLGEVVSLRRKMKRRRGQPTLLKRVVFSNSSTSSRVG